MLDLRCSLVMKVIKVYFILSVYRYGSSLRPQESDYRGYTPLHNVIESFNHLWTCGYYLFYLSNSRLTLNDLSLFLFIWTIRPFSGRFVQLLSP